MAEPIDLPGRAVRQCSLFQAATDPGRRPAEPWTEEQHRQAVAGTLDLLDEYFRCLTGRAGRVPGRP